MKTISKIRASIILPATASISAVLIAITAVIAFTGALTIARGQGVPLQAPPNAAVSGSPSSAPAPSAITSAEDIRDIRGPKHIAAPFPWRTWLAAAGILIALAYGAWLWNRRRSQPAAKLPYEIALERLERARTLMHPETARDFSFLVSEIVRSYIQQGFHLWAVLRTTEEFLHDLLDPSYALLISHRVLLGDFLRHCDLAKFARWQLSLDEMESMHRSACTFVLETGQAPLTESASPRLRAVLNGAAQPIPANPLPSRI